MKAAASENKNVNIKWFRGTPNDLLDLYGEVLKDPLVQSQKSNLTFQCCSICCCVSPRNEQFFC